ncbi:hypothetical protein CQA38_05685 [Campylobacter sp. MIT 12-5580]|uniref:hypothetical protein n=1 Tax=Campylobacter sp. MIT 12-5580 TaxID=2040651 RepID=UPI0010F4955A|nr:hypothetical protein [Campylobacter sp. MIT 12-5580]TKX29052.1 hypothetical protein CQA38_05685 [Campylobacter sp. MIT 12-5580]
MLSTFTLNKESFKSSLSYEREDVYSTSQEWKQTLNKQFDTMLKKEENKEISKEDLSQIFAENNNSYISSKLNEYLSKIKDLNGNDIDFSSLDIQHQQQIIEFLKEPLENTKAYGTRANLSDIKVDLSGSSLYIEANLHTIDGKTLSIGAKFMPQELTDYKAYCGNDELIVGDRVDTKILFVSQERLNTSQKKDLLEKIQNQGIDIEKNFADFKGYIGISLCGSFDNPNNNSLLYQEHLLYRVSNVELNLNQAKENIKNLPKEENESKSDTLKLTFKNIIWNNIKSELSNFNDLYKLKIESEFIKENSTIQPLKTLLASDILSINQKE